MIEKNAKYLLALFALTILTFSSSDVRATMSTGYSNSTGGMLAGVADSISSSVKVLVKVDAKAEVVGQPKLELTYASDSKHGDTKRESALKSTFNISVKGGKNGVYVPKYQYIEYNTVGGKGGGYYVTTKIATVVPTSKLATSTSDKAGELYFIPKNTTKLFKVSSTIDPRTLFAGTYVVKMSSFYVLDSGMRDMYKIAVSGKTTTNSKTIVGEVSPYITSINTPVNVGDKLVVSGVRFNDVKNSVQVYVDNSLLADTSFSVSSDGTQLTFIVGGNIPAGQHNLYIENSNGRSNIMSFYVGDPIPVNTSIKVLSPNGGEVWDSAVQQMISWNLGGAILTTSMIKVSFISSDGVICDNGTTPNSNNTYWIYPNGAGCSNIPGAGLPQGNYKVKLTLYDPATMNVLAEDESDSWFEISYSTTPVPVCYNFAVNLTLGSEGADVIALQTELVNRGFLSKEYTTGYFGSETKSAVMAYQTSVGLPSTGFVGPETRAALNACVTPQCPKGYVCTDVVSASPEFVSQSTNALVMDSSNDDVGMFSISFKVTAIGGDVYIPVTSPNIGVGFIVDKSGTVVTSPAIVSTIESYGNGSVSPYGNIKIEEGMTETLKLTVSVPMGAGLTAGAYRVSMNQLMWDTNDTNATSTKNFVTSGLEQFKTSYLILN